MAKSHDTVVWRGWLRRAGSQWIKVVECCHVSDRVQRRAENVLKHIYNQWVMSSEDGKPVSMVIEPADETPTKGYLRGNI